MEVLQTYFDIVSCLENPSYDHGVTVYIDGEEIYSTKAVEYLHNKLLELDLSVIDLWLETKYTDYDYWYEDINWDYEEVLSCFVILDDMLVEHINTTTDNLDNETTIRSTPWYYNTAGELENCSIDTNKMLQMLAIEPTNPVYLLNLPAQATVEEYDDNGRLSKTKVYTSEDHVGYVITPTYDDAGNKISDLIRSNDEEWTITYAYEGSAVTEVVWEPYLAHTYKLNYTYDANGNVAKTTFSNYYVNSIDNRYIAEFTYDAGNTLVSGVYTYQECGTKEVHLGNWEFEKVEYVDYETIDSYTFTFDDQNRLTGYTVTFGDTYDRYSGGEGTVHKKATYSSQKIEFVYGPYYLYDMSAYSHNQ